MSTFDFEKAIVSPYVSLFVFCSREFVPAWKGSRHFESGFFSAAMFEYWHEDFLPKDRDTYFYTRPEVPKWFFWYLPKRLPEYFYRFFNFAWALFHDKPAGFDNYSIDLQKFYKIKNITTIEIGNSGGALFPAWMTGDDIKNYTFGLHKYTSSQSWYDLVFLNLPQGTYNIYNLYDHQDTALAKQVGFLMTSELYLTQHIIE